MLWGWLTRNRPIAPVDFAIAAFILALGQVELVLHGVEGGDPLTAHVLWAGVSVCALFRRSRPLLFVLVAIGASVLRYRFGIVPNSPTVFPIVITLGLYGVGAYGPGPVRSAVLAGGALLLAAATAAAIAISGHGPLADVPAAHWLAVISTYVVAACGGIALRDRGEALRAARARVEATPTVEEAASRALLEERTRIARELHTVVTASVRQLLKNVGRARGLVESSPGRARETFADAQAACRSALDELRRMLSLLRAPDPPAPAEPAGEAPQRDHLLPLARIPTPLRAQALPLLVLVFGLLEAVLSHSHPHLYGSAPPSIRIAGAVALAAAFLPRRQFPLLTAIAVGALILIRDVALDDQFSLNLPVPLAAFVVGAYGRPLAVTIAGVLFLNACTVASPLLLGIALPFGAYVYGAIITVAAWVAGLASRRRLAEATELRGLAEEERRRNRSAADQAVAGERLRVARELHDLVGHGLTSIVLHSAAAERVLERNPGEALAALDTIEGVGVEIEGELAGLLAALEGPEPFDAPRLPRLPELIRRVEASGMRIELELAGDLADVPPGPAAAVYRIVQEGLTNARKHGAGGRAWVCVAVEEGRIRIEIENPIGRSGAISSGGHGLIGIRERVRVYAGSFRTGASERGTWLLEAELPLDGRRDFAVARSELVTPGDNSPHG